MAETISEMQILLKDVTQHQELSNATLLEEMNNFYQNQFYVDIGMKSVNTMYNFQTLANVDEYAIAEKYRLINSDEFFLNGVAFDLYFDKIFYSEAFPDAYITGESIGAGDAAEVTFSGTLQRFPVVPKSMIVSDDAETFKDVEGTGVLTGSLGGSGAITYATGVYSITFNSAPADGQSISTTYSEYTASQPNTALYYDNTIKFRPIPDATYDIKVQVVERPDALTAGSTLRNLSWGDAIVYGTAINILRRDGNDEAADIKKSIYKEKLSLILKHQYKITSATNRMTPRW